MAKPTRNFICANHNCGFSGPVQAKSRGSVVIACFLLLLGAVPGLLYIVLMSGYEWICPKCSQRLAVEHR